nr:MAG TPA: hypothetical protein [Caudoviricetes sp.]
MLTSHDVLTGHRGHAATLENLKRGHISLRDKEHKTLRHIQLVRTLVRIHLRPVKSVRRLNNSSAIVHGDESGLVNLISQSLRAETRSLCINCLEASKAVELRHDRVVAADSNLAITTHDLQHIVNSSLSNTARLSKVLHALGIFQRAIQLGDDIVSSLVHHISLHLSHTLGNRTVKVAGLKLTIVNRKATRDALGGNRVLSVVQSRERHIAARSLEAAINALVVIGLHIRSLVEADALKRTHEVEQTNTLKQLRLDSETNNRVHLRDGHGIVSHRTRADFLNLIHSLVNEFSVNRGSLASGKSRENLNDRRGLFHTVSGNVSHVVHSIDFKNTVHNLIPQSILFRSSNADDCEDASATIRSQANDLKIDLVAINRSSLFQLAADTEHELISHGQIGILSRNLRSRKLNLKVGNRGQVISTDILILAHGNRILKAVYFGTIIDVGNDAEATLRILGTRREFRGLSNAVKNNAHADSHVSIGLAIRDVLHALESANSLVFHSKFLQF